MPAKIAISKTEYQRLRQIAQRYEMLRRVFEVNFFEEPPTKNIKQIAREFKASGLYNENFLKSLERGLKDSAYFSGESTG